MAKTKENIRLSTPDLLKGVSILLMIQVHLMELFARPDISNSWMGEISLFLGGTPAAPLFMMIMGYFVAKSNLSTKNSIKRGVQLFIWGILLNIGLNLHLIYRILFESWNFNVWHYIFGVDILHFAGLSIIIISLISKSIKEKPFYLSLLIFLTFFISFFTDNISIAPGWDYLTAYFIGGTEWSYFPLIPWIAYPISGYLFFNIQDFFMDRIKSRKSASLLILSLIAFITLSWDYSSQISFDLPTYYHHGFDYYIWAIIFSLIYIGIFYKYAKNWAKSYLGKYLIYLGKNITNIYVFQWLIIGNLATLWFQQKGIVNLLFSFISINILSFLLSLSWNRITKTI